MSLFQSFLGALKPFIPTGVAVCIIILVIAGTRYLIDKRSVGSSKAVRRQVITILFSFIGLLIVIMIMPEQYLSETSRGQLLSLIGILLSAAIALSSTTLMGNAMAGLMLRSIKSFRPGDFVRVGNHFGRVTAHGLFHVEIQTEDRDLTTLPNLYMVTNPVKVILASGTIVSAEVSLGYDVSYADAESCLMEAAGDAGLSDPFVLITGLGDYSVTYRASGLLAEVRHIISIRSKLRRMMMDSLHRRGIEIVSPAFMNTRALPEHRAIMPRNVQCEPSEETVRPAIEKLFFDIAEEAASTEKLNEMLAGTLSEIDSLKNRGKDASSDEEKEKIKHQIEQLEARQEQIRKLLEITAERKDK
jgi:small conductance mechanosensitive channel